MHLWADRERRDRFAPVTHSYEESMLLYADMNARTAELLRAGHNVVFDANFNDPKDRDNLRSIAAAEGATAVVVWIDTPFALAKLRATELSEGRETRIWGNMPLDRFEHISTKLQPPLPKELSTRLDGSEITREIVADALAEMHARERE